MTAAHGDSHHGGDGIDLLGDLQQRESFASVECGAIGLFRRRHSYPNAIQTPVFEFKIDGESVMRRRSDDWVNATHILKAAGFDKPARTRILEREVQKGVHEKIQGGYGKYQGTCTRGFCESDDSPELLIHNSTLQERGYLSQKVGCLQNATISLIN